MLARLVILIMSSILFSSYASSKSLHMGVGDTFNTEVEHIVNRIEMNYDIDDSYWQSEYCNLSINHAFSLISFRDDNKVFAASWAPNATLHLRDSYVSPYIQVGLGIAYMSEDHFKYGDEYVEMGSKMHVESSVGIGIVLEDSVDIRLKAYHYSNARAEDDNDGMNTVEFSVGYRF